MTDSMVIPVTTEDDVVVARQAGRRIAQESGFGLADQCRFATAISELTRNVIQHAGTGRATVRPALNGGKVGIEATLEDDGPGIPDINIAMEDGYTTRTGNLGAGLPGARRLTHEFHLETRPSVDGTKVTIRMWKG